ncbi:putative ubiquitin-specific processing protease 21 [Backusella circina FSU 941]|nr:putative ubiquitin-specific processing protease 21 [Backusella circina FSU 941]
MKEEPEKVDRFVLPDDYEKCAEKWLSTLNKKILGTTCYTWTIENWSDLENPSRSPVFKTNDGTEWNILLFPEGTNGQKEHVSLYLESPSIKKKKEDEEEEEEEEDTYCCAQFALALTDPLNPTRHFFSSAHHRFTSDEADWGFTRYKDVMTLSQGTAGPYLVDNKLIITAILRIVEDPNGVLWHNFKNYDSKKVTNYVGLTNQGATCYMNSLFQSLYFTNYYRKSVYQIPTENEDPSACPALALQRLFYNLQFSDDAVTTIELTRSFGWDSVASFMQHDVQEFNRLLQDNLEKKMRGTEANGAIPKLFVGRMKSYIKCINVDYESSRLEDYYDIQLNVKNCATLEDSFKDYCAEEILEGDNKYQAEGHGLQDAKKGVIFESFPPVLHLQLKRFEYDMERDMMVKINDRHEFPTEIDLASYMSSTAEKPASTKYILHSVLVHTGDQTGGHYFAFVRPTSEEKWFKFDDNRVTPATLDEVLEDNFGGEILNSSNTNVSINKHFTNAYMLVYIRETCQDEVLAEVTEQDIPSHLIERIKQEKAAWEKLVREKQEQHLYLKVFLIWDNDFCENTGYEFVQRTSTRNKLGDTNILHSLSFPKDKTYDDFIEKFEKETQLSSKDFRLWVIVNRENGTMRPDFPIPSEDYNLTLEELRRKNENHLPYLRFYVEFPEKIPDIELDYSLVFVKFFVPLSQSISGIGKLYIEKRKKLGDIQEDLVTLVGLEEGADIDIFEEVKPGYILELNKKTTVHDADLQNGDILCIQEHLEDDQISELKAQGMFFNAADFLTFLFNRVMIYFIPRSCIDEDEETVELILAHNMPYFDFMQRLATILNEAPDRIQIFVADNYDKPKGAIRPMPHLTLHDVLQLSGRSRGVWRLFYEILPISIFEMDNKKVMNITICYPTLAQDRLIQLVVPKAECVSFALEQIREGIREELVDEEVEVPMFRLYEGYEHRFQRDYQVSDVLGFISDAAELYAEPIPEDEHMEEGEMYISVCHYYRELIQSHSIPFKFLLKKDEIFTETKKRLQKRTGLNDAEWKKVKFSIISRFISNITDDNFKLSNHKFLPNEALGLDYPGPYAEDIKTIDRGLFIKN